MFVMVVCMAQFMTQAGLYMSIAPMYLISNSSQTSSAGEMSWLAAAYSSTVGTFILATGRLRDVFSHRLMFIIGFPSSGLWSLVADFSVWADHVFFDCSRALQRIGPAMLLPNSFAILGRAYPLGLRRSLSSGSSAPPLQVVS
jgi:MFS family permease